MTIFLDLAGSFLVRASLITIMLGLTVSMNDTLYQSTQAANAKGCFALLDSIIYCDVNEAGYNVSGTVFQHSDSTDMQFLGDINGGGVPETIRYYTVVSVVSGDTLYNLYRYVNNVNDGVAILLGSTTKVNFSYYNDNGTVIPYNTDLGSIKQVRITMVGVVGNVSGGQSTIRSEFKIYPPNLL
jgi:hypothetical protein